MQSYQTIVEQALNDGKSVLLVLPKGMIYAKLLPGICCEIEFRANKIQDRLRGVWYDDFIYLTEGEER